jgi:hypothetical protein
MTSAATPSRTTTDEPDATPFGELFVRSAADLREHTAVQAQSVIRV